MVDEKGYPPTGQNQGGEELKADGFMELPDGFRGALSVDYLSSYIFRLAFGQSYVRGHQFRSPLRRIYLPGPATAIPWDILSLVTRTIRAKIPVT